MNKIFKKVISLALIGTLCIGASTTTFASELSPEAKAEATQTNESERKVNWWQVGWKVLSDYFEKLIDLDGQSVKDSNWAYLVSPSIEFNTGEMGNEVYFKPEVNNSVGSMRMHGHRVIFVDIFAKINLILSDANNDTVSSAVTETNQYMFYDKNNFWGKGKWAFTLFFGVMYMLAEYGTFKMANNIAFNKLNAPDLGMIVAGAIISAIGMLVGSLWNKKRHNQKK